MHSYVIFLIFFRKTEESQFIHYLRIKVQRNFLEKKNAKNEPQNKWLHEICKICNVRFDEIFPFYSHNFAVTFSQTVKCKNALYLFPSIPEHYSSTLLLLSHRDQFRVFGWQHLRVTPCISIISYSQILFISCQCTTACNSLT